MTVIYLAMSIVCSSLINLIFRSFGDRVDKMSAIVINYLVCVVVALVVHGKASVFFSDFWNKPWFLYAVMLGVLFIVIFYLIALTNQYSGVSVAAAASKLGVIIPVVAGVFIFNEPIRFTTTLAIVLSLIGVVLISKKESQYLKGKWMWITLPMAVLVGSGIIDTTLKYIQFSQLAGSPESHPTTIIFGTAGLTGLLVVLFSRRKRALLLTRTTLVNGVILGVPNYFSILFLLLALNAGDLTSVVIFPLNNVSIVALSAIASIILFREKMSKGNIFGLVLALVAIFIISRYQ